jgi:hypothetical protein
VLPLWQLHGRDLQIRQCRVARAGLLIPCIDVQGCNQLWLTKVKVMDFLRRIGGFLQESRGNLEEARHT